METNKVMDEVLGDTPDLTVSDLYSAEFKTAFRGYNKQRVRGFLARVADAFEVLEREAITLREANTSLKDDIARFREMESALTEALAGAQQLNERTIAQAKREAELILKEADVARQAITAESAVLPDALREEIAGLRATRARLRTDLRAVLDIHHALLSDDDGDHGDAIELLPENDEKSGGVHVPTQEGDTE